ncbi:hypothetical protein AB6813_18030 [bacterium RCC_150]
MQPDVLFRDDAAGKTASGEDQQISELRRPGYLLGLIGDGVLPSLSPPMHEREAEFHGVRLVYRPIDLPGLGLGSADLKSLLRHAQLLGFNGLNIKWWAVAPGHLRRRPSGQYDAAIIAGAGVSGYAFGVDIIAARHIARSTAETEAAKDS